MLNVYHIMLNLLVERTKVLKNLGSTYTYLGKFSDAEKCFDQALEIANKQFDINRQAWVIKKSEILEQMGKMKRKKGEIIASLELLKQCVDLKSKLYFSSNPYHPGKLRNIYYCAYVTTCIRCWHYYYCKPAHYITTYV